MDKDRERCDADVEIATSSEFLLQESRCSDNRHNAIVSMKYKEGSVADR